MSSAAAAVPTMPVAEVRPGMKGTGRSVFSGQKVEEFGVEVIDVVHNAWPNGDMILCRLSGCGLENSGVIAGMSGSPVYIDGRLVGAVAYAWGFAKEPIAGVTPIGQMLELWDQEEQETDTPGRSSLSPSTPSSFSRLPLPVAVPGLTPQLSELITPVLQSWNLVPVAAAGRASASARADSLLVPGSAVGVALVEGDVQFTAIGTLTWREGDRILAFGHPMFQAGRVKLPMTAGVIHTVLASFAMSSKLFSPTEPIGTITQDRLPAVGGRIGPVPAMTPVSVELASPTNRATYRFRVVRQDELAATLVALGLAEVVYRTEGAMDEMTLRMRLKVRLPGDSVQIEHRFSGANSPAEMFKVVRDKLGLLINNRFQPVTVAGIELDVAFTRGRDVSYLLSARPDRRRVRPGETINAVLKLRDYRGEDWERTVKVAVPPTAPDGTLNIVFASRDSLMALEAMRAPGTTVPGSFARLLELLGETGREDELLIAGYTRTGGLTVGEQELPSAPASLRAVLLNRGTDEPRSATSASLILKEPLRFDRVIYGVAQFELEVNR